MAFKINTDLSISGSITISGKTITSKDISQNTANYSTLDAITGMTDGDLIYVEADEIAGVFKYDSSLSTTVNYGTIYNGWVRQHEGNIQYEWFYAGADDDDFNLNFALLASVGKILEVNSDITVNSSVLLNSNQILDLGKSKITPISPLNNSVFRNRNLSGDTNITILGGEVIGTDYTGTTYDAVRFTNVDNGLVKGMKVTDVSIIPASDSGNLNFINCTHIVVDDVYVTGTWRAGTYFNSGNTNTVKNSYFSNTRDSGIIMVNSDFGIIDNNFVDDCGQGSAPNGASNIAANMVNGIFSNNTSINAGGTINGNGFTLGHPLGYDAHNTIVEGNFFGYNATKGLFLQGSETSGITISNNVFVENGVGSTGTNSSGLGIAGGYSNSISNNTFDGNRYGISIDTGQADNLIQGNIIKNSTSAGIRNAGIRTKVQNNQIRENIGGSFLTEASALFPTYIGNSESTERNFTIKGNTTDSTDRFTNALLRFKQLNQVNNTSVGFSMSTSTTDLYGMHFRTERQTSGTLFKYVISSHNNSEIGDDLFEINQLGLTTIKNLVLDDIPVHANEAAASGLTTNTVYKTATGELRIKL